MSAGTLDPVTATEAKLVIHSDGRNLTGQHFSIISFSIFCNLIYLPVTISYFAYFFSLLFILNSAPSCKCQF